MPFKKTLHTIYLSVLVITPIILLLLPGNYFDSGESLCLSVILLEKECFACGMTRAIQHLIHLDFNLAWNYNKLSFIVLPLLVTSYLVEIKKVFSKC
tara:strand:+ start:177 stop:467 length:291 start_codon:yes stop_codon:yes gene_type:complete